MTKLIVYLSLLLTLTWSLNNVKAEIIYRTAVLNDPNYLLSWESDFSQNTTTFTAEVRTKGFVGLGLSYTGGMGGADIFIGGVLDNGTLYSGDYHGKEYGVDLDTNQDWILLEGSENDTHTILKFSRIWQTCDGSDDIPIIQDATNLIWSFGESDSIDYHGQSNRGTKPIYLLDPPNPEVNKTSFLSWPVQVTYPLPTQDTVYYCSIHKAPQLKTKHHIVGFRAKIEGALAERHTHHFVIYKCIAPPDTTAYEYFEQYAGKEGGDCYVPEPVLPVQDCQYFVYIWSVGGEETFLPDGVGYPFGTDEHEYYMVDLHYDNPQLVPNLNFTTGAEIFYTDILRPVEAAALSLGHKIYSSQLIPPKVIGFKTVGHCSSNCTARYIPPEGITIFNAYLHSHTAGRKVKIRHFRDGKELPWLSYDDHYNFDYQQSRHLRTEIKLLPGDHLTYECTYDTMNRTGITTAGISTRTEMCYAALWHYPASSLEFCMSQFPIEKHYERWGVEEVQWWHSNYPPTIVRPQEYAGMNLIEYLDNRTLPWDASLIAEIEREHLESEHELTCYAPTAPETPGEDPVYAWTTYPQIDEPYQPEDVCRREPDPTPEPTMTTSEPTAVTSEPTTVTPDPGNSTSATTITTATSTTTGSSTASTDPGTTSSSPVTQPEISSTTSEGITTTTGSNATTTEAGTGSQDHNVAMPAIIGLSLFVIKVW